MDTITEMPVGYLTFKGGLFIPNGASYVRTAAGRTATAIGPKLTPGRSYRVTEMHIIRPSGDTWVKIGAGQGVRIGWSCFTLGDGYLGRLVPEWSHDE